jgi:hypothetical protein
MKAYSAYSYKTCYPLICILESNPCPINAVSFMKFPIKDIADFYVTLKPYQGCKRL